MNINEFIKEVFKFEDKKVKIVGTYEEPWFCGRDVCGILEYSNYRVAIADHVDEEDKQSLYNIMKTYERVVREIRTTPELNNETKACYITEAGLYDLVMHSRLPNAKRFRKWITKEVLPALRKKGEYKIHSTNDVDENDVDELTKYFEEQLRLEREQYQQKEELYKQQLEEQQDYISILKDISVSDNQRNCTEVIYIATCDSYAKRKRFKIGGVQSSRR